MRRISSKSLSCRLTGLACCAGALVAAAAGPNGSAGSIGGAGPNSAILTWSPPTTNTDGSTLLDIIGFNVYRGTSPASMMLAATVVSPASGYVDANLAPAVWYWYVTAVNALGTESAPSAVVSKTVVAALPVTAVPAASPAAVASTTPSGTAGAATPLGTPAGSGASASAGNTAVSGPSGNGGSSGAASSSNDDPAVAAAWNQDSPEQHRSLCWPRGMVFCVRH